MFLITNNKRKVANVQPRTNLEKLYDKVRDILKEIHIDWPQQLICHRQFMYGFIYLIYN